MLDKHIPSHWCSDFCFFAAWRCQKWSFLIERHCFFFTPRANKQALSPSRQRLYLFTVLFAAFLFWFFLGSLDTHNQSVVLSFCFCEFCQNVSFFFLWRPRELVELLCHQHEHRLIISSHFFLSLMNLFHSLHPPFYQDLSLLFFSLALLLHWLVDTFLFYEVMVRDLFLWCWHIAHTSHDAAVLLLLSIGFGCCPSGTADPGIDRSEYSRFGAHKLKLTEKFGVLGVWNTGV